MPTPDELYDEAVKLKEAGQLPEAVAKLEEGLTIDPNHVLTHSAVGRPQPQAGPPREGHRARHSRHGARSE